MDEINPHVLRFVMNVARNKTPSTAMRVDQDNLEALREVTVAANHSLKDSDMKVTQRDVMNSILRAVLRSKKGATLFATLQENHA